MVRRRVEIELIQDAAKRHTTFTKRRKGLQKKVRDFCNKFDAQATVLTFSGAGNGFAYGHPSVDVVLDRYLDHARAENNGAEGRVDDEIEEEGEGEAAPLTEAEKNIAEAIESGNWEGMIRNLGLQELGEIAAELEKIKIKVASRAQEIAARGRNDPDSGTSGGDTSGSL